jgi:hypothetical protein
MGAVQTVSAGESMTFGFGHPNPLNPEDYPLGNAFIIYEKGAFHYVPEEDQDNYVPCQEEGDYAVLNYYDQDSGAKAGQIKAYAQEVLNENSGERYFGVTIIDGNIIENTVKANKEIPRDLLKMREAAHLDEEYIHIGIDGEEQVKSTDAYFERVSDIISGKIEIVRTHMDGNTGMGYVTILYPFPEEMQPPQE